MSSSGFLVRWREPGVPGRYVSVREWPCETWQAALEYATQKAYQVSQGQWIDVYTPAGTHVAHIMGMC